MESTENLSAVRNLAGAGLLSNGEYTVLLTEAGSGFSRFHGTALTRWRGDGVTDGDGFFIFIRDLESGEVWSMGLQPTRRPPDHYEARQDVGRFLIQRADGGIVASFEACVDPDRPVEIRRIVLLNDSSRPRRLELTSYMEIVLQDAETDLAHPAFSKLFVETAYDPTAGVLTARRRPRSPEERHPYVVQALMLDGRRIPPSSIETDRARFIGRGRSLAAPGAFCGELSGTAGSVLDPILSMRTTVEIDPNARAEVVFLMGAGFSEEEALEGVGVYRSEEVVNNAFFRAADRERELRQRLDLGPRNALRYHRLAGGILYGAASLRPESFVLENSTDGQDVLQRHGLRGARPLILARIADSSEIPLLRVLLKALAFWRAFGLFAETIVLNDKTGQDAERLQKELANLLDEQPGPQRQDLVLRHADRLTDQDQKTLESRAHLVVTAERFSLIRVSAEDEDGEAEETAVLPAFSTTRADGQRRTPAAPGDEEVESDRELIESLTAFNGYGGFSKDGREYVLLLTPRKDGSLRVPPMPWVNVVANEQFGCLITEQGAGYTWSGNSRENRLTPWSNDPVLDPHGEALYVRDEVTGRFWSAMPGPAPAAVNHEVRHGLGYSRFLHVANGLEHDVLQFVARRDPLKITRLRLTNRSDDRREVSVYAYCSWVLGNSDRSRRFVVTSIDEDFGSVLAVNRHNGTFGGLTAFAHFAGPDGSEPSSLTADRREFLGEYGDMNAPRAVQTGSPLSRAAGAGFEPCAAFRSATILEPGDSAEYVLLIGQTGDLVDDPVLRGTSRPLGSTGSPLSGSAPKRAVARIREFVGRYRVLAAIEEELEAVREFWSELVEGIQVETPSDVLDPLINAWLVYQNVSCRLWARTAFYQAGGAFGFRDQLQDSAALTMLRPEMTRDQILLHAAHQFVEGDVMHWWHPPQSRGLRTRFSDDLLWLPYIATDYCRTTGDHGILEEEVPYLTGVELREGEDEIYIQPRSAPESESLYHHCCRAIERSLTRGEHGLPLMGTGDWNDGMNRVGRRGRGESVWLGFFLAEILEHFIPICERFSDLERAQTYSEYRSELVGALETAGWDGTWYRRAFYDDGTPIGSRESEECQIDALVQAWSVISGAADPGHAHQALESMERRLVDEAAGIIRLLDPPFNRTDHDPGYIKGYLPGVRENGGQYTHAALWAVLAFARAGRCDRAGRLLEMLSPVARSRSAAGVERYQVEPYVVAADVYGVEPHVGRGGWTWYTGSAGWMYRIAVEEILGIRLREGRYLEIAPCIPPDWPSFRVRFRHPLIDAYYDISVGNPDAQPRRIKRLVVNGEEEAIDGNVARLAADLPGRHRIEVLLGP